MMFKRCKLVAAEVVISSATAVPDPPAEAAGVRHTLVHDFDNDGVDRFGAQTSTEVSRSFPGAELVEWTGGETYLVFEIDTETRLVHNYFLSFKGGLTVIQSEVTFPNGLVILYKDTSIINPVSIRFEEIPLTRIPFAAQGHYFVLEVEADLLALESGGRVDISPFKPYEPLGNGGQGRSIWVRTTRPQCLRPHTNGHI